MTENVWKPFLFHSIMAYNLRTGLIGSGDIDVNVSLSGLTADNITSGVFGLPRIPTLGNSKISDLDATKLTGTIDSGRLSLIEADIPNLSAAKITSGVLSSADRIPTLPSSKIDSSTTFAKSMINAAEEWPVDDIPDLPATKITSGVFASADRIPNLSAAKITSGVMSAARIDAATTLDPAIIPDLPATKITSGTFASPDRIPALPASKITSGTFPKSQISTAETWPVDDIPYLPATKIASGELDAARIPNLSALKIQSDTLNTDRIPNLDASKITTGTISSARLPATASTSDCLMLRGLMAAYGATAHSKTITTTYAALASQTNGSFTAPASGMVVVTLTFYLVCAHDKAVLARLVKGSTTTEFTSAYSLNSSGITCQETDNVYVVKHTTADSADTFDKQVQVTWLLTGLSSGSTYAVDAHVKTGAGTATCNWGDYGSANHPPILFEVRSIPSSVASVVISEGGF
jgi:hypothetical protein